MVMDTATLKDFLVEAYLVEGFAYAVDESKQDSAALMVAAAYDSLYSKYGTTADAVDSTLDYYTRHPQQLEEVYSRVTSRLRDLNDSIHKAVFVSEE